MTERFIGQLIAGANHHPPQPGESGVGNCRTFRALRHPNPILHMVTWFMSPGAAKSGEIARLPQSLQAASHRVMGASRHRTRFERMETLQ